MARSHFLYLHLDISNFPPKIYISNSNREKGIMTELASHEYWLVMSIMLFVYEVADRFLTIDTAVFHCLNILQQSSCYCDGQNPS